MKKYTKSILGRQMKDRSKYNPVFCSNAKACERRRKQIEKNIIKIEE